MEDQQQTQSQHEEMNVVRASGQELSPGFHFKPSDSEIVSHYLMNKVRNPDFTCAAIGEVNLNMIEPWDLPKEAKWGKKEWYFFFQKDRKYPTGLRVNRATKAGYWKMTGKDKEVYDTTQGVLLLVGMKKTLVFYKGRAPEGNKTNWVMYEYRLEGSGRLPGPASASSSAANSIAAMKASPYARKGEWVVCRVFHKTTRIKEMTTPAYQVAMADVETDQNQNNISPILIPMPLPLPVPMPVPVPMQFPMMPDFAMDLMAPYYPNFGAGMPPMIQHIVPGKIQINGALFGNPIVMSPNMVFYEQMDMGAAVGQMGIGAAVIQMDMGVAAGQMGMGVVAAQMDMGAVGAGGFDGAASESRPSSTVSQNDEQANASEISSMMSVTGPRSATTTIEVDGIWEYKY